ncbi:MAG: DUF817 domain-containing protein [Pseudomonadota bacterium]|jgi:uncharacterized membrane protein YoaT (DUF817 family)|uniref:DUF817 domain-containing protein n=1 Tax=Sphingobium yanoikuyae TaxID=13690 RepID=UPI001377EB6F|nr:DUF817 domain-containing protein [Sphingobium yanoikuyae]NBB37761.1 DUF817 family protein [Sphingobium yanoikuyae]
MNDPTGATRFARIRAHLESVRVAAGPRAWAYEFLLFGFKQGWACLFGGLMLALLLATHLFYPAGAPLHRYDFLTLSAVAIQIAMLALRLESPREALVICAFHLIGTIMELFKTHAGSWVYPEASLLHIGPVPLFSGFMYAAVGSYIARVWRIFDFGFSRYPPVRATVLLASAVYVNFFAHHWLPDVRIALFAAAILLFGRSWIWFTPWREPRRMPLLLGFFLVALFIWLAENIGTFANAWTYPSQRHGWEMVSLMKLGAWYLLMIISFVLVSLIHGIRRVDQIR